MWANTYWVKPLQSNPRGSDPPLRYGAPRNRNAVSTIAAAAPASGAESPGEDGARPLAGTGNGRGVAPVEARPATSVVRAIAQASATIGRRIIAVDFMGVTDECTAR